MLESQRTARVRFGDYEVDLTTGEFYKNGGKLRLQGHSFQILVMLLEQPGRVITRDELKKKLWSTDIFVDFDLGLNKSINQLRAILNDSAGNPRYIETLPRLGYRWLAEVQKIDTELEQDPNLVLPAPAIEAEEIGMEVSLNIEKTSPPRLSLLNRWLGLALFCIICILAAFFWLGKWKTGREKPEIISLAVLPFKNLSQTTGTESLANGLTYTFTNEIGQIQSIEMVSSRSMMRLNKQETTTAEIARELKVDWLVDPTVQFQGDKVAISLQLIEGATERLLWASPTYERKMSEIANLQRELAREVAFQLKAKSSPAEKKRLAQFRNVNPEAYKHYLSGRFAFNNPWGTPGWKKALESFQKAVEVDPSLAEAYAGMADAYVTLAMFGAPIQDSYLKARNAAEKALELNESSAEAIAAMADVKFKLEWNWKEAGILYDKAYSINPNFTKFSSYNFYLTAMGRFDEAIDVSLKAAAADPLTPINRIQPSWCYCYARRYDDSIRYLETVIREVNATPDSEWGGAFWNLSGDYALKGDFQKAYDVCPKPSRTAPGTLWVLARLGRKAEAEKILADAKLNYKQESYLIAYGAECAMMGKSDDAFFWLEQAFAKRDPWMTLLKIDPMEDSLRSDPRFKDLLRRMNFPE